jgi:uncharacterized protein involved in response to NO
MKNTSSNSPNIQLSSPHSAVWNLGFRPLFLSGIFAALILMLIWLGQLLGGVNLLGHKSPLIWHAHEMVFGFGGAVIAGFLLTASANWAGTKGVSGKPLILLILFWTGARIFVLTPLPMLVTLCFELGFWLYLGWLLRPSLKGRNRIFWVLLGFILIADGLTCLELAGFTAGTAQSGLKLAVTIVISMIVLISGRVLPFFAEKAIPGLSLTRKGRLDQLALFVTLAFGLAQLFLPLSAWTASLAFLAGLIHLYRWWGWQPWQSIKLPILWVLYLGYVWLILGFILHGFVALNQLPASIATHAWTVGAIGTFIYGMISRVGLGHTGRSIQASKAIVIGYLLISLAAIFRLLPAWLPAYSHYLWATAGMLWVFAFAALLWVYLPILTQPRIDGKLG